MGLVLSRNVGEEVIVYTPAGEVRVTVTEVKGCQVKLDFKAPETVPIWRAEVAERSKA